MLTRCGIGQKKCDADDKCEQNWRPEKYFDIRHKDTDFGVFMTGVWSWFGPVLPCYAFFPAFWSGNFYSLV